MKLTVKRLPRLPKLSWLAVISPNDEQVTALLGPAVECRDDFFVAGCWDGCFEHGGFADSSVFYGTGAKVFPDRAVFSTPSHALERLVYYVGKDHLSLSNSPAFLMAYEDLSPDPGVDQYEAICCSILEGYGRYTEKIPLKDNRCIHQVIAANITVRPDLSVQVTRRKKDKPFSDFADYRGRLFDAIGSVVENGQSEGRQFTRYRLCSTISGGYDSTACCVVAGHFGCRTAVSLSGGHYEEDNGTPVCEKLGYTKIIRRDRNLYRDKPGLIDAEYVASGELGTMLQFSVFEDVFADSLVFFGARGSYWDKDFPMTEELLMKDYAFYETDVSWTENALKNGYLCIPLPAFGASVCDSIKKVTNSPEMAPYTLGGKYDKPIPRRIAEEAGVPRALFGQVKHGGGFSLGYDNKARLLSRLSHEGADDFTAFCRTYRRTKPLRHLKNGLAYGLAAFPTYANYLLGKVGVKHGLHQKTIRVANPFYPDKLIGWGMTVMKARYRDALS